MIKSMTGFGKATTTKLNKTFTVEIRSLNSKQQDFNLRVPFIYKEKELDIRNLIANNLVRGKIDLNLNVENNGAELNSKINKEAAINYFKQLKEIGNELNIDTNELSLQSILKFPDILTNVNEEISEEESNVLIDCIKEAINQLDSFRKQEGEALEKDFILRIKNIENFLSEIKSHEKQRIDNIKDRINNNLEEFFDKSKIDENRFEQEIIYYLEKLDITEEKVRLENHCDYFSKTLLDSSTDQKGKKLGFITQEIGREINTIGSKANDTQIQHLVIKMKDELEKIKEQTLNIL